MCTDWANSVAGDEGDVHVCSLPKSSHSTHPTDICPHELAPLVGTGGMALIHALEAHLPKEWLVGKDAETHFCKYQSHHVA